MPQCCSVPLCSRKTGGHRFPRDKERLKQWLVAIRRDFTPTKHSLVCKEHFTEDDFEMPKDSVLEKPRPMLKKDAVPSIFIWNEPTNYLYDLKLSHLGTKRSRRKKLILNEKMKDINIPTQSKQQVAESDASGSDRQPVLVIKTEPADDACTTEKQAPLASKYLEGPHASPPDHTYVQPSTSTQIEIKVEFEEAEDLDYKTLYYRSQEEVIALRTRIQDLVEENKMLSERNQRHTARIERLVENNNDLKEEIERSRKKELRFTEMIRELTEKNKYNDDKNREDVKTCDNSLKSDIVAEDRNDLETLDLTIQRLEKNKSLNEQRQKIVEKMEYLGNIAEKVSVENRSLRMKVKMLLRRNERLKLICKNRIGMKSKEINALQLWNARLSTRLVRRRIGGSNNLV